MRTFDPDKYEPDADFEARPDTVSAFREQLRRDYEGLPLEKVMPGDIVKNDYGPATASLRRRGEPCAVATRNGRVRICWARSTSCAVSGTRPGRAWQNRASRRLPTSRTIPGSAASPSVSASYSKPAAPRN